MVVLLDTDHFSILQREVASESRLLQNRLGRFPGAAVKVSIISFQEQSQGWLAWIRRARKPADILRGFHDFQELLKHYSGKYEVLRFDTPAMTEFLSLKQQRIRIGTSDLRIAAIARANGVKLLSRNLRDFRQVPNLDVEDWTA